MEISEENTVSKPKNQIYSILYVVKRCQHFINDRFYFVQSWES